MNYPLFDFDVETLEIASTTSKQHSETEKWTRAKQQAEAAGLGTSYLAQVDCLLEAGRRYSFRKFILTTLDQVSPRQRAGLVELASGANDGALALHLGKWECEWHDAEQKKLVAQDVRRLCKKQRVDPREDITRFSSSPCITWAAGFITISGYAAAARFYIHAAEQVGLQIQTKHLFCNKTMFAALPEEEKDLWIRRGHRPVDPDLFVASCPPASGGQDFCRMIRSNYPGFRRYALYTTWEADPIPGDWTEKLKSMDEVWVPSRFNYRIFSNALNLTRPVRVLPHGLPPLDLPQEPLPEIVASDRFTFLSVFRWSYNKGYDLLLRAWGRAFTKEEKVQLVIHAPGYDCAGFDTPTPDLFHHTVEKLGLCLDDMAPIIFSCNEVSHAMMDRLYRSANAFVLPTRGEGWCLPLMEAMQYGLPVIGSACGGVTDFLSDSTGWPIPCRDLTVLPGQEIECLGAGQTRAEPDLDVLVAHLQRVRRGGSDVQRKCERAKEIVETVYSPSSVGENLRELLGPSNPSPF
jgi:glycosyltransferase involved in cell wall biosynthesis